VATLTLADPSLVLLVGAAGSGKSTLATAHFAPHEILSSDALRAAISGDAGDQAVSRLAFAILHRDLTRRLEAGRLTVVDATNVRAVHRRPLITRARAAGVPTAAIVLDLPRAEVLARNAGRDRVVDPEVVDRQLGWLRATLDGGQLVAEGVDPITVLRTPADVAGLVIARRPVSPPR